MNGVTRIILKSGKDQSVRRYHPWIFSGAIKKIKGEEPAEGDVVEIYDNKDNFLALGHYQIGSIAVRIFAFEQVEPDINYWRQRIKEAYNYRKRLNLTNSPDSNVYRLLFAEGEGMPGIIADYYNGVIVMQMHSIGMYKMKNEIASVFKDIYGDELEAVYDKSAATIPFKSGTEGKDEFLLGDKKSTIVKEYGNQFEVDWINGQKTGFFIDQRENRKLVQHYSAKRNVLNVFGYTGGFSVYALSGGAELVHSVDSSAKAIDLTEKNIELNFGPIDYHKGLAVDAFEYLDNMDDLYDLIILDPPAFAKHQNVLHNALQGYKKLNAKALRKIKPGGILFTYSCSQVVSKENFRKSVFAAAANTGRKVRIMHQLCQPPDHPVSIYHPEGEYLKGLVLYVE
jgi:23S rRNA (cytosine1962-C5)-methyltransferase